MKSYKNKNYEQALIETFLKFDDMLRSEKINSLLKQFNNKLLAENYEIDMKISFNKNDDYLLNELREQENDEKLNEEKAISNLYMIKVFYIILKIFTFFDFFI